jgi:Flp pilus assembly protein TadB
MGKVILIIALSILILTMLFKKIWSSLFIGKEKSEPKELLKKRIDKVNNNLKTDKKSKFKLMKNIVITKKRNTPIFGLSDKKREEIKFLLENVIHNGSSTITPEEIHFDQLTYAGIYIFICLLISIKFPIAIVALVFVKLIYNIPVKNLREKYNKNIQEIMFQFPDFYDSIYSQYKKGDINVLLSDVITSFLPIANKPFEKMLKRVLIDLTSGEDYALKELDARHSNPIIHKFCSIMRLRLKGDEASQLAMHTFRESLQSDVMDWMVTDLEKRETFAARLTYVMVIVMFSVAVVIFYAQFLKMAI